ncbi:hypothetical protein [Noviherbaspirillum cavernae]|uniref:hypothetical protein n=1 Tax=Noviherbaspirillum cavernae TaxID=2320862 RepID=UPI0011C46B14|nr:hypothetical protein [Noviherbaspirillum cavernae]
MSVLLSICRGRAGDSVSSLVAPFIGRYWKKFNRNIYIFFPVLPEFAAGNSSSEGAEKSLGKRAISQLFCEYSSRLPEWAKERREVAVNSSLQ